MHQIDHHVLPDVDFNGHCLINNIYITKNVINIYIFLSYNTNFTLNTCLFGSVKLSKNADPDKY